MLRISILLDYCMNLIYSRYIHVYKEKQFHALKNYNFGIDIQPYIHVYEEK